MRTGNRFFRQPKIHHRINQQIVGHEFRLLDETGKQIGIVPRDEAFRMRDREGLDLVEIAGQARPPVIKLIDYKKFLYQLKKKKQEEKRNTKTSETKQVQFGPFIDPHDLEIKLSRAREFITDGNKVRFVIRFKGRQLGRKDIGFELMRTVVEKMGDVAKVDREAKMEGRQLVALMSKLSAKDQQAQKVKEEGITQDSEVKQAIQTE